MTNRNCLMTVLGVALALAAHTSLCTDSATYAGLHSGVRVPTQSAPQASKGEQFMLFSDEEMEAQLNAENQKLFDRFSNELTLQLREDFCELKRGETLWSLAREDIGSGATNAQIQERAQQYMEVNGITDLRTLQIGQSLTVPTGTEVISATTMQAYAKSHSELRVPLTATSYLQISPVLGIEELVVTGKRLTPLASDVSETLEQIEQTYPDKTSEQVLGVLR